MIHPPQVLLLPNCCSTAMEFSVSSYCVSLLLFCFFVNEPQTTRNKKKCFPQGQLNRLDSSLVLLLLLYLSGGSHTHKFLRNDTVLVFVSPHRNIFLKKKKIGSSSYFILFFLPSCLPYVSCAFGGATRSIDIKKTTSLFLSMCVCVSLTLVGVSSATHLNPVCRYMMLHNSPFSWRRAMFSPSNESCALLLFFFFVGSRGPQIRASEREREKETFHSPSSCYGKKREKNEVWNGKARGRPFPHGVLALGVCVYIRRRRRPCASHFPSSPSFIG